MNRIENVFDIAEELMENPSYVSIDDHKIQDVASIIKLSPLKKFEPASKNLTKKEIKKECYLQLLGGAINYCYWHGKYNIRPNGCCSTKMFDIILSASNIYNIFSTNFIYKIKYDLGRESFPLLEERYKHIDEIVNDNVGEEFIDILYNNTDSDIIDLIQILCGISGYGADIFLKRASLFFLMMYRKFGWFEKDINKLPVPADYHLPKIFNHFQCFIYTHSLNKKIHTHQLIPKGSLIECEIRAATIIVARKLCELTDLNIADVDYWFWGQRKNYDIPFHLTITTDY